MPATHIIPAADATISIAFPAWSGVNIANSAVTIPQGPSGGQYQIKAGQPVPLELVDAYTAHVGAEQVETETTTIPQSETVLGHGPDHSGIQVLGGTSAPEEE